MPKLGYVRERTLGGAALLVYGGPFELRSFKLMADEPVGSWRVFSTRPQRSNILEFRKPKTLASANVSTRHPEL